MTSASQFTKEREKEILEVMEKSGVLNLCPICRNNKFQLQPGYFINVVQENIEKIELGGESIPTVILICHNCGFVSQHSLGVLGLLSKSTLEEGND